MPIPFPIPDLECDLRRLIAQIPPGRVSTCGMLAHGLGSRFAAKWIGYFSLHHPHDDSCVCHRIVRAGGELGGYVSGDLAEKIRRLEEEKVVARQGFLDLAQFGFEAFNGDMPLAELQGIQENLALKIRLQPPPKMPKFVGGVDVAYRSNGEGQAAYSLHETDTGRSIWSHVVRRPVRFPYITGFLSFRELPILLDLLDEVRAAGKMAEAILVDGSGILHPRRAGVASHLGVVGDIPTIGITKKLLCGQVDLDALRPLESRPVFVENSPQGVAIRPTAGSLRSIFVSPGHQVDLPFAEQIIRKFLLGRRLPEPLYWADRLSKT
jgi:deoxyribonuclease V